MRFVVVALTIGVSFGGNRVDSLSLGNERHRLEAVKSWNLQQRRLQPDSDPDDGDEDEDTPYTIKHKKPKKKNIPFPGGDTTHGILIDGGSQGTRLHIYEWDKRFLLDEEDLLDVTHGKKLTFPTSNARWTDAYLPGLDVFAYHKKPEKLLKALAKYLEPLLDFAKEVLQEKADQWNTYPIYLKATGGMRTLPKTDRVRVMDAIRQLFSNETFSPFYFEDEHARVISGEEEAIYGWAGVNFALGTLIQDSLGSRNASFRARQLTYGMLEMGGASTQIAMYENHGDLMANLYNLQLGEARHWNVYVHSYLYFGINGAWTRLNSKLYWGGTTVNPCLPLDSSIEFSSWATLGSNGNFLPRSANESKPFSVTMVNNQPTFDFESCSQLAYSLLRKEANSDWCDFEMDANCGFAGIYQPPLPQVNKDIDEFVATSNFVSVFEFLQLGDRAPVSTIITAAEKVCRLSWKDLKVYNSNLSEPIPDKDSLAQMCFRSVFVYQLLYNGWEFGGDYVMAVADVINGQKMGWALGCMLYEINMLPWNFHPELLYRGPSWWLITLYVVLGTLGGSFIGFSLAMRVSKKFNERVRKSTFFRKSGIARNPVLRMSFALPPLDALDELYGEDDERNSLAGENSGPKYT